MLVARKKRPTSWPWSLICMPSTTSSSSLSRTITIFVLATTLLAGINFYTSTHYYWYNSYMQEYLAAFPHSHHLLNESFCRLKNTNDATVLGKDIIFSRSKKSYTHLSCPGSMDTTPDTAAAPVRQSSDNVNLTVAMSYYGHPASLLLQIDTFANYPKQLRDQLKIVIIDDGSPPGLQAKDYIYLRRLSSTASGNNSAGKSIVNDDGNTNDISDLLDLRIFYIATNIDWNMAGAKNLACHVCETSRILLLDLDLTVPEDAMTKILDLETRSFSMNRGGSEIVTTYTKHRFNRTDRNKIHPGVSLQDVGAYFASAGCDEDFAGSYGSEDTDYHSRWRLDPSRHEREHAEILLRHPSDFSGKRKINRCSSGILRSEILIEQCRNATANLFLPQKEPERNRRLLREKRRKERWSNLYLRFPWYQVTI